MEKSFEGGKKIWIFPTLKSALMCREVPDVYAAESVYFCLGFLLIPSCVCARESSLKETANGAAAMPREAAPKPFSAL